MLYQKILKQLMYLGAFLTCIFLLLSGAMVYNIMSSEEVRTQHELLKELTEATNSHSNYILRYALSPAQGLEAPGPEECQLGEFLARRQPPADELIYYTTVVEAHQKFHDSLEHRDADRDLYLASQNLTAALNKYMVYQEEKLQGFEVNKTTRLFKTLLVFVVLMCLTLVLLFARFIGLFKNRVVPPLEKALGILKTNGISPAQLEEEPLAILTSIEKVGTILSLDKMRQQIYPFWNSTFDEDDILTGSLRFLGEAGQIVSAAYYRYDSFSDKLLLQASYAFPQDGQQVLTYGEGPVGEAMAGNKIVKIKDPELLLPIGLGTVRPSLVVCYPVCTQKMYGVLVFAFPEHTTEDHLRAMGIFAAQLGIVLDRVRQLDDLKKMATELKSKTALLDTELTHKKSILNSSADGIVILTPDGTITSYSKGAEEITGYRAQEVLGRQCCEVMKHHSQDYDNICGSGLCALCQTSLEKLPITGKELFLVHKTGRYVPVLLSVSPILSENGEVVEVLQIFKDLTEIKNNLTQLEQASRSKSEFLATMSHELRTPLNAILGFGELLEAESFGSLNEKQKKFTANILTAGRHLLTLINDILDITRVESGKMEWERELIDLPALFTSAVNLLKEKASQNGLKISLNIAAGLSRYVGDERKIKQIIYNLLSNAVKFTPSGGQVGIDVALEEGRLQVEVWDTGIGIPEDKRQAVFEPFYQVDNYLTRKQQGTGLGLALVKKMVELSGGRIWVTDGPGKATIFKFFIPEQGLLAFGEAEQPAVAVGQVAASEVLYSCVLIEDDHSTAELLETYLWDLGIKVEMADSGEEGLNKIMAHHPDLVVLDVLLPGMSGWEVLGKIKSSPDLCGIPVLVVSILEEKRKGLALGARDYLVKPVDKKLLQNCVQRLLKLKKESHRVLVIDDDAAARELMSIYLEAVRMKVSTALTAEEGLAKAAESRPDLIFLDLMLPGMDGFEFLRKKENDLNIAAIPVVVVTSKSLSPQERKFLEERVLYIARKSEFTKEHFTAKVLQLLEEGE